jgi:predicted DCC family thiol-disulfide oxidoreductase YuxK
MCSGFVQFVIKIDPKGKFRFASLQSDTGKELLTAAGLSTGELGTVVLINKGKAHTHSDVALESARILGGGWTLFYTFKVLPRFIRDGIYKWIARNRYRWFGKKDACMMPTPDIRQRFLEVG